MASAEPERGFEVALRRAPLTAMVRGAGELHSFDVVPEAGGLLSEEERAVWDFRLIDRWRGGKSLKAQLATLPQADLCFHDADHGYLSQFFEFGCLWEQLTETGILVSDDVDFSYGLIDFCEPDGKRPQILIDRRKAVGVFAAQGRTDKTPPKGACPPPCPVLAGSLLTGRGMTASCCHASKPIAAS